MWCANCWRDLRFCQALRNGLAPRLWTWSRFSVQRVVIVAVCQSLRWPIKRASVGSAVLVTTRSLASLLGSKDCLRCCKAPSSLRAAYTKRNRERVAHQKWQINAIVAIKAQRGAGLTFNRNRLPLYHAIRPASILEQQLWIRALARVAGDTGAIRSIEHLDPHRRRKPRIRCLVAG